MFECISIESLTHSNLMTGCDDPIWPDVVRSGIVRMRYTRPSNARTQQVPDSQSYVEMCRKNQTNPCLVRGNSYNLALIKGTLPMSLHDFESSLTLQTWISSSSHNELDDVMKVSVVVCLSVSLFHKHTHIQRLIYKRYSTQHRRGK